MAKFPGIRTHAHVNMPIGGGMHASRCDRVPTEPNRSVPTAQNPGGNSSAEMQQPYDAWRPVFPFNARLVPYKEMNRIALRNLPYLPLHYESAAVSVSSIVRDINAVPPTERDPLAISAHASTIPSAMTLTKHTNPVG